MLGLLELVMFKYTYVSLKYMIYACPRVSAPNWLKWAKHLYKVLSLFLNPSLPF